MKEHFRHSTVVVVVVVDKTVQKYGIDTFKIDVIYHAEMIEEINEKEQYWSDRCDCMVSN